LDEEVVGFWRRDREEEVGRRFVVVGKGRMVRWSRRRRDRGRGRRGGGGGERVELEVSLAGCQFLGRRRCCCRGGRG